MFRELFIEEEYAAAAELCWHMRFHWEVVMVALVAFREADMNEEQREDFANMPILEMMYTAYIGEVTEKSREEF